MLALDLLPWFTWPPPAPPDHGGVAKVEFDLRLAYADAGGRGLLLRPDSTRQKVAWEDRTTRTTAGDSSTVSIAMFIKDPAAVKDYVVDWTDFLGLAGDTISTATFTVPAGLTKNSESHDTKTHTVWIQGGTPSLRYDCISAITTVGGRSDQRTITILIQAQ